MLSRCRLQPSTQGHLFVPPASLKGKNRDCRTRAALDPRTEKTRKAGSNKAALRRIELLERELSAGCFSVPVSLQSGVVARSLPPWRERAYRFTACI